VGGERENVSHHMHVLNHNPLGGSHEEMLERSKCEHISSFKLTKMEEREREREKERQIKINGKFICRWLLIFERTNFSPFSFHFLTYVARC
jgi:hypothetical protein